MATSLAALAALALYPAAVVWLVLMAVLLLSHYASLTLLASAVFMPLTLLGALLYGVVPAWYLVYGLGACALIIFAHRDNITRLWKGTERKVGEKARPCPAPL